jgi:D-arabinose 1-dehydrogenase-like Zn-dependent alcohol dehydrogenase
LLGGPSPGTKKLHKHLRGKKVGVIGIGGLGHMAIRFAREMGADYILGLSRRHGKRGDVLALGADDYIATEEEDDWMTKHGNSLDIIVATFGNSISITGHLQLLKRGGRYIYVGMPGDGGSLEINWNLLVIKQVEVTGSLISSPGEMREMLEFAAEKDIVPWTEVVDMRDANQAISRAEAGKARYRIVLRNQRPSALRAKL